MDKKIEKTGNKRKALIAAGIFLVMAVLAYLAYGQLSNKVYRVDRSRITVATVEEDKFQDVILVDGNVEPITSVLVNTPEGGTVEEIFAEEGVIVKKGDPIVRLGNPSLLLSYMTQETAIVEQINNLRNLKLSLEKDQRNMQEALIDVEYELTRKSRDFQSDTFLFTRGAIADNQYYGTYDEYNYRRAKRDFLERELQTTSKNNDAQLQRIERSIDLMERNLEVIHRNIAKLLVRAPVTGMLSSFNPVIGEAYSGSQTIAKIDVLEGFKVRGRVDEYYLSRVKPGLKAWFSFSGKQVELEVTKVLPEVEAGNFGIDLEFRGEVPEDIANGQSLQIKLELSAASMARLIPRGSFFQSSGGRYVFVLTDDNKAVKRYIRIGRQNPNHYEVLEGLEAGERIITSSYDAFREFETVVIAN